MIKIGFDSAFYKYPKFKDTTAKDIWALEDYFYYMGNDSDWARKNYNTVEDYLKANEKKMPTKEQIEHYRDLVHKDEFKHDIISDTIEFYSSWGISLNDIISDTFDNTSDSYGSTYKEFTKDELVTLLIELTSRISDFELSEAKINYAYQTGEWDEEREQYEAIKLLSCDGIEVEYIDEWDDESSGIERLYNYITLIKSGDPEKFNKLKSYIKAITKILKEVNFDEYNVYYYGGW